MPELEYYFEKIASIMDNADTSWPQKNRELLQEFEYYIRMDERRMHGYAT